MKRSVMFILIVVFFSVYGKMETYDRKSISLFKVDVQSGGVTATQSDVEMVHKLIYEKLLAMGRFDYNPIPAGISDPTKLFEIVKEYAAANIEERAARQWDIKNDYYGTNFVTGENVDKIINGAFILFPTLETFVMTKKKGSDDFNVTLSVIVEVYSATNTGTPENPVWEPHLMSTIRATGNNALGNLFDFNLKGDRADKRKKAVKAATNGMLVFLEKELRKIDAFKIKALVTKADPKHDKIHFGFGKNVGVNVDDAYRVGYFQKNAKGEEVFVETGFMKVRSVKPAESVSQLMIVTNPGREPEDELFNEYDQAYEYPLVGLNFVVLAGFNQMKSWENDPGAVENLDEIPGAGTFGLRLEYDLARFIQIPETYIFAGGDLAITTIGDINSGRLEYIGLDNDPTSPLFEYEFNHTTVIGELGLLKKFFFRQFGIYFGGAFVIESMDIKAKPEDIELDGPWESQGFKGIFGINYLMGKNAFFDAQVGYGVMDPLKNKSGDEIPFTFPDNLDSSGEVDNDKFLVPEGLTVKLGFGFTI